MGVVSLVRSNPENSRKLIGRRSRNHHRQTVDASPDDGRVARRWTCRQTVDATRDKPPLGSGGYECVSETTPLVIEVDGADHFTPEWQAHDRARDAWMQSQGIRVLRFMGKQGRRQMNNSVWPPQNRYEPR